MQTLQCEREDRRTVGGTPSRVSWDNCGSAGLPTRTPLVFLGIEVPYEQGGLPWCPRTFVAVRPLQSRAGQHRHHEFSEVVRLVCTIKEMSLDGIRRLQKRYRRGTENVINTLAHGVTDTSSWNFLATAGRDLGKEWSRMASRVINPDADSDRRTACARAWLDTEVVKGDIRKEIESLLAAVRDGGRHGTSASVTRGG